MATQLTDTDDVLVDCRSVWKVFGKQAPAAMRAIAERGLGKREVLQEFGCQLTKDLGKSAVFITHDLDEAIRIGDRIAIMKDGVIIQVGTAEEIILNPADDYVAEFVAGISRLHLIKAHSVMVPVDAWRAERPGADAAGLPGTSPEAEIDELIDLTLDTKGEGIAVVENGSILGVVTPRSLLLGVKGAQTSEPERV